MLTSLANLIQSAADALFMPWVVGILLSAGLFLTIRTGVVQVRRFGEACRVAFVRRTSGESGALTPFQAFMTALAASIGTGNIAGVATAIVSGGPGALFWIWGYGFVATAIKFTEAVLGVTFREVARRARVLSGPMYYLRDGLKLAGAGAGPTRSSPASPRSPPRRSRSPTRSRWCSNSVVRRADAGRPASSIAVLAWLVIIGGIKSIGRAAEKLAPLKVGLYLAGGLVVIVTFAAQHPATCSRWSFREAFSTQVGGWRRVRHVRRDALRPRPRHLRQRGRLRHGGRRLRHRAQPTQPAQQGLNAVMEVFIVSFVTSTISALTILLTGVVAVAALDAARRRSPPAFNTGDARRRRLGRRLLRVPVRLHDADRLGLLRRAVPRVHPRPRGHACRTAGSTAC